MAKKLLPISIFLILSLIWGISYYNANKSPYQVPTEYYSKGDIVDIGMNFYDSSSENPVGYKLQVCNATIKTYRDMLTELGKSDSAVPPIDEYGYPRADYVYDVELKISNENNKDGYLVLSRYLLIDKALTLEINYELWDILLPDVAGAAAITLKPNTEKIIHIPFTPTGRSQRHYRDTTNQRILNSNFALCISEYPVRKMLRLT